MVVCRAAIFICTSLVGMGSYVITVFHSIHETRLTNLKYTRQNDLDIILMLKSLPLSEKLYQLSLQKEPRTACSFFATFFGPRSLETCQS